ncbi:NADAR family protein [filamentous cyanobacterium LEGE 11480]|uniref:NADAR family protein n=1 Tax=Romeriopsis navalis LEGE 11480 TaxID=2777977 RepID=A0A928VT93_9CYAN|nr:NADAR family protein [Romeriopsis navalis]MBE9033297.1 NADAR family protein [Romeriopsis navalis LEGE 11480]
MPPAMINSKATLIQAIQSGTNPEYLCFWGHRPAKDGSITKSCFSQWWASPFFADGCVYPTAEHYMMAEKARLFDDRIMAGEILKATNPKEVKALGRKVKGFDQTVWEKYCCSIVVEGNYHKFNQNSALQKFLLDTGDKILVEASPVDKIWGIGLAEDDAQATVPEQWPGSNLLGFALMVVRDRIRNQ